MHVWRVVRVRVSRGADVPAGVGEGDVEVTVDSTLLLDGHDLEWGGAMW